MTVSTASRLLLAGTLVLLVAPGSVAGQTVRGALVDELSGDPVPGATVHLLSEAMEVLVMAPAAEDGSFAVSPPPGAGIARYVVVEAQGFTRILTDPLPDGSEVSLGTLGLRPLGWSPESVSELELDARTVAAWCADLTDSAREGVVVGRVRDRLTEEGLAGLPVRAEWDTPRDTVRLVVGGDDTLPYVTGTTGPGGLYYFCRVPADRPVRVVAEVPAGSSEEATLRVESSAVNRVDLVVSFSRPGERSALFGRVVDVDNGSPVAQARVYLTGERGWALTNDRGFFSLERLPTGVQILEVEHLAYRAQRHPVLLEPGAAGQVLVRLAADAIEIDGLEVTVRSTHRLRGIRELERRRELGVGRFFDQQEIRARGIYYLGDVLRETPGTGARILGDGVDRRYVIRRVRRAREYCVPAVFLNGRRYRLPGGLMALSASEMEVVEVHRGPGIPAEFATFDGQATGCGVVSAWTQSGG
jgi:hypothetical protein